MQRQKQVPTHSAVACSFRSLESDEAREWHLDCVPLKSLQLFLHFFLFKYLLSAFSLLNSFWKIITVESDHPVVIHIVHRAETYTLSQGTLHVLSLP